MNQTVQRIILNHAPESGVVVDIINETGFCGKVFAHPFFGKTEDMHTAPFRDQAHLQCSEQAAVIGGGFHVTRRYPDDTSGMAVHIRVDQIDPDFVTDIQHTVIFQLIDRRSNGCATESEHLPQGILGRQLFSGLHSVFPDIPHDGLFRHFCLYPCHTLFILLNKNLFTVLL